MKILANKKITIVCLILSVLLLAFYVCIMVRPVSYGMPYHSETVYAGYSYEGTMKFYPDGILKIRNTNFAEELQSFYYYQDGYIFFTLAVTEEEYEQEIAQIKADFEGAVKTPFYADEINAFRLNCSEEDGYANVYTCMPAIVIAIVGGILERLLIGITATSSLACKKAKK